MWQASCQVFCINYVIIQEEESNPHLSAENIILPNVTHLDLIIPTTITTHTGEDLSLTKIKMSEHCGCACELNPWVPCPPAPKIR